MLLYWSAMPTMALACALASPEALAALRAASKLLSFSWTCGGIGGSGVELGGAAGCWAQRETRSPQRGATKPRTTESRTARARILRRHIGCVSNSQGARRKLHGTSDPWGVREDSRPSYCLRH